MPKLISRNLVFRLAVPAFAAVSACGLLAQAALPSISFLSREQTGKLMPGSVFFQGQVAPVQMRNSGGVRLADSKLVLAALVDNSGYASAVQQVYQGYLIAEVAVKVGDTVLPPGAYGFGFVAGDRMVAMDLGGHQLLTARTVRDEQLARPNPLQFLPDPASTRRFRLYLGRSYVTLEAVAK